MNDTVNCRLYSVSDRWRNEKEALQECHWQRETKVFGEKSVPVPLCWPLIPQRLAWDKTWDFCGEWTETNCQVMAEPKMCEACSEEEEASTSETFP